MIARAAAFAILSIGLAVSEGAAQEPRATPFPRSYAAAPALDLRGSIAVVPRAPRVELAARDHSPWILPVAGAAVGAGVGLYLAGRSMQGDNAIIDPFWTGVTFVLPPALLGAGLGWMIDEAFLR